MNTYAVHYIAVAGIRFVEAESEEEAAEIVERMSVEELWGDGGEMDDMVQSVELIEEKE